MVDSARQVQRALARQRADASYNKSIDQTAARMSANTLAIADIAEAVSGVIKGRAHRGPAAP
jgi:hypothetical protein